MKQGKFKNLSGYIKHLQQNGRYTFIKEEAITSLNISESAFIMSVSRAKNKNIIVHPKNGFYVIVPVEYQLSGAPPPSWFIDDLMKYLGLSYYVGLLSAASLHGASHHMPQVFQVITNKQIESISIGRIKIKFIFKKDWPSVWYENKKTYTGYINISTKWATILDLLKYPKHSGQIDNIAMILNELNENLAYDDINKYLDEKYINLSYIQRLGYLLDFIEREDLSSPLYNMIKDISLDYIQLVPDNINEQTEKNHKWHIIVNHKVELDI